MTETVEEHASNGKEKLMTSNQENGKKGTTKTRPSKLGWKSEQIW